MIYSGLFLEGPRKGLRQESVSSVLHIVEGPTLADIAFGDRRGRTLVFKHCRGFWVPDYVTDPEGYIIEALMR